MKGAARRHLHASPRPPPKEARRRQRRRPRRARRCRADLEERLPQGPARARSTCRSPCTVEPGKLDRLVGRRPTCGWRAKGRPTPPPAAKPPARTRTRRRTQKDAKRDESPIRSRTSTSPICAARAGAAAADVAGLRRAARRLRRLRRRCVSGRRPAPPRRRAGQGRRPQAGADGPELPQRRAADELGASSPTRSSS